MELAFIKRIQIISFKSYKRSVEKFMKWKFNMMYSIWHYKKYKPIY